MVTAVSDVAAQTPANQHPQFPSSETGARSVAENTAAEIDIGAPVAATDAESDTLTYSLGGVDAASFDFVTSSGQLRTKADLDYEAQSTYLLTVSVSDSKDDDGNPDMAVDNTINVTVTVINSDEEGEVRVSPTGPQVGFVLRARLSDPDGGVRSVSWRWASSQNGINWTNVSGATQWHFTPNDTAEGKQLRVTASYRDAHGRNKNAQAVLAGTVTAREQAPGVSVHTLVSGLTIPWGIGFTPDGTMLFTERSGRLTARLTDGTINSVTADFSDLYSSNEVGLMDIVVDPDFDTSRRFYTCQGHDDLTVQVIAWTINGDFTAATRVLDPLVGDIPAYSRHSGCRLRFGPQDNLWIATGDAAVGTTPQDLSSLGGKILRVDASTGSGVTGNPFTAAPFVYTYGHRNVQGLALRPGTNEMWAVEHGPTVDDEINLLVPGGNYGWDPVIGYNESVPMTDLVKYPDAVEAKWSSGQGTLAASGGIFIEGEEWDVWDGRLAVASLKDRTLRLFDFAADGTLQSEVVMAELNAENSRLRTPMMGPDGALYISTSNGGRSDKILKVVPYQPPEFVGNFATAEVAENAVIGTVVATIAANDANDDTLTYSLSGTDAALFAVTDTASGGHVTLIASLDHETRPSLQVELTATDPQEMSDSITLIVDVTDVDEPADILFAAASGVTANNNALAVDENHNKALATFSASDPENKAGLTYMWSVGGSDDGDFALTDDGVLSFAAVPNFERPADSGGNNIYDITVSVRDSDNYTASIAVTVTVDPVNEPPVITGDAPASIEEEGTVLIGTYQASDPEGALIVWQPLAGDDNDKFEFTISNGGLVFRATPDYEDAADIGRNNVYDVTLGVSAGGHTTTFDVAVSVTNKDEDSTLGVSSPQPRANADYTAMLSDPDKVLSTIWTWERSTSRNGPWTVLSGATSGVTTSVYRPVAGDVDHYLRVTAAYTDGHGPNKSRALISTDRVKAAPVNNVAPLFSDRTPIRSIAENARAGATVGRRLTATDTDSGDVVTYQLSGSDLFTIDSTSGQIRVVADDSLNYETAPSHSVTVKASDPLNASDTVTVTIEVTDVNEAPDAVADTDTATEDGNVTIDVLGNDSDPEDDRSTLTLRVITNSLRGRATVNEPANAGERPTITYTPNQNYHGPDIFTYQVRDAGSPSLASTATVSVEIHAVNDPPVFATATTTRTITEGTAANTAVGPPVTASDVDDATLSNTLAGPDSSFFNIEEDTGQITVAEGTILVAADRDQYTVTVQASDSARETDTIEVTINVTKKIISRGGGGGGGGLDEGSGDGLPPSASELFEDIEAGVWYESAVSWMILHDVTSGCTTNMFCPDQNLTRQQFVTFLWRAAGRPTAPYLGSEAFTDVTPGGYAEQSIGWAVANEITKGCTPGQYGDPDWQFCPTQHVTRGQMATLLYRHTEADYVGADPPYTDVEPNRFYLPSITWLTDFQVVPGCGPTLFCPDRDATRAEAALFINGIAIRPHIWGEGNTSFIPQPN